MADGTPYTEEQNRTRQHFDEHSDYWRDVYEHDRSYAGYTLQKQHRFVIDMVQQTPNAKRILDVGCGAGVTMIELAEKGYAVSGLDIAPKMIELAQAEAQRRQLQCDFKVGLAESLPYPDQSFDVLIALGLLGNILDDKPVLKEMVRVLKPGGRLLLTMPNLLALDLFIALPKSLPIMLGSTRFRQTLRSVGNLGRRLTGRPIKEVSKLRFNQCVIPQRFVSHLEQNGFSLVKYHALTFGPMMPFGLRWVSEEKSISISEKIVHNINQNRQFSWMGTILVYDGWRI
jgi:ubiquinone/menaquinone biosynthesis C-methylase UbiE